MIRSKACKIEVFPLPFVPIKTVICFILIVKSFNALKLSIYRDWITLSRPFAPNNSVFSGIYNLSIAPYLPIPISSISSIQRGGISIIYHVAREISISSSSIFALFYAPNVDPSGLISILIRRLPPLAHNFWN